MKLGDLFNFHNAISKGFVDYDKGSIVFVTNGFKNNGVVGMVKPKNGDRVFDYMGICISAFCEATVQKPPFLPRGNGGSGLLVLEPKNKMSYENLLKIASYINTTHRWRFSYGRMVNEDRVKKLDIEISDNLSLKENVESLKKELSECLQNMYK